MALLNNPCTENKEKPLLIQTLIAFCVSFSGMIIIALPLTYFDYYYISNPNYHEGWGFWDCYVLVCLLIGLIFSNVNILLLLSLICLNINPVIYNNKCVFLESMLYYGILFLLLVIFKIDLIICMTLPFILIILSIMAYKVFCRQKHIRFFHKLNERQKYLNKPQIFIFEKNIDIIICFLLPILPLIFIFMFILTGI